MDDKTQHMSDQLIKRMEQTRPNGSTIDPRLMTIAQVVHAKIAPDDRIKTIESNMDKMKSSIQSMIKIISEEKKGRNKKKKRGSKDRKRRRKRRKIEEDSDSSSSSSSDDSDKEKKRKHQSSEEEEPDVSPKKRRRSAPLLPHGKTIMDIPEGILTYIFSYFTVVEISALRLRFVCKAFHRLLDQDILWNHWISRVFGSPELNSCPWVSYSTSQTEGIYALSERARTTDYRSGHAWVSAKEKYKGALRIIDKNRSYSGLLDSYLKSCNAIPCVMLDSELGMRDTYIGRSRFSKKSFLGSMAENGAPPITILYAVINRVKGTKPIFEAKVVCVDKEFISSATKKMHRNDVMEGIMRMLSKARSSMSANPPYWDATVNLKEPCMEHLKELKNSLDRYDPNTDSVAKKHVKESEEKKGGPIPLVYRCKPFAGCPAISESANDRGYIIMNMDTFRDVSYVTGDEFTRSVEHIYFRKGNLWMDEKQWYNPSTRFVFGYKCFVSSSSLSKPDALLNDFIRPKNASMSPIGLTAEEFTLDLQIIHSLLKSKTSPVETRIK